MTPAGDPVVLGRGARAGRALLTRVLAVYDSDASLA
jgi:hypothetical protein